MHTRTIRIRSGPGETPLAGGCDHCTTITMATLDRLLSNVVRSFGTGKRIWLTEYGYQTSPQDRLLGVSYAAQARFVSEGALRALLAPRVDVLIHYLVRDEPQSARWQSGLLTARDIAKPAYNAFRFPFALRSRTGSRTVLDRPGAPGRASELPPAALCRRCLAHGRRHGADDAARPLSHARSMRPRGPLSHLDPGAAHLQRDRHGPLAGGPRSARTRLPRHVRRQPL